MTLLNRQRVHPVNRRALARFAERLAEAFPPPEADRMAVCLVGDRAIRALNKRFRGKGSATDVLSFPGDGRADPEGGRHLGDIVISVPRARLQAGQAGHSVARELKILLLHGYLHLLGYDHETDDGTMSRLERRLVKDLVNPARDRRRR